VIEGEGRYFVCCKNTKNEENTKEKQKKNAENQVFCSIFRIFKPVCLQIPQRRRGSNVP
jgi:hypothetical protein